MTKVVEKVVAENDIEAIILDIQQGLETKFQGDRQKAQQIQTDAAQLRERRAHLLDLVEKRQKKYKEVDPEIQTINQSITALECDAILADNNLKLLELVKDEAGIRGALTNLKTYLEPTDPDDTQELLDIVVRNVQVTSTHALLNYGPKDLDKPEGQQEQSDRISLAGNINQNRRQS